MKELFSIRPLSGGLYASYEPEGSDRLSGGVCQWASREALGVVERLPPARWHESHRRETAVPTATSPVFGFPEFLTALALLMLVYSASDARYRFRLAAAALPLRGLTFVAILSIGAGTLIIDLWYAERWPTLPGPIGQAGLQAILACGFLVMTVVWVLTAFVRPPQFGRWNAKHFYRAVFWRVMQGDAKELAIAAEELAASMSAIVKIAHKQTRPGEAVPKATVAQEYAHHLLMLIGNRRFCKQVARTSPHTAIRLFEAMGKSRAYRLPVRAFVQNLMTEALRDPESIIYDEADEFSSDLVGAAKPFSRALFGDYHLVEALHRGMASPTDLGLVKLDLTATQYNAYASASLVFIDAFLKETFDGAESYALNNVFETMKFASSGAYRLSEVGGGLYDEEETRRVREVVRFVQRVVGLLKAHQAMPLGPPKPLEHGMTRDIFDKVADLMFEVINDVASVKGPADQTWYLQHNLVWGDFFGFDDTAQWLAVRRRLVWRLYMHVKKMDTFANYQSAKVLGYCLNILGVEERQGGAAVPQLGGFHRRLLRWFAARYLTLRRDYPDVAEACLVGGITFDEENLRLVKTYAKMTKPEPARRYLPLKPAAEPWDRWS